MSFFRAATGRVTRSVAIRAGTSAVALLTNVVNAQWLLTRRRGG